jgi:hydroxyacylglutathione hydrolase
MLEISCLPALSDNYIWMLDNGRDALVVDPGEAVPVLAEIERRRLRLTAILLTHHHGDHVDGVAALTAHDGVDVYGPTGSVATIPGVTREVGNGAEFELLGQRFEVIAVPGHTLDHIAYYGAQAGAGGALFCGDTLFSAGCGRLFEGTAVQMHASLQRLAALPDATAVCCAHEYTLSNLAFAVSIEPDNEMLARHQAACRVLRAADQPTLPTTLGLERQINPFLRCAVPTVVAKARAQGCVGDTELAVFTRLRLMKDGFQMPT